MQIGNYEIEGQLGVGAMGVVYRARHVRVRRNRLFAVKLMHARIASRPDLVQRFHREIEVVGRLEHENIVSVVDAGEHEGSPYLVMEYLEGEPLENYIRQQRPLDLDKKLEIMAAVCRGLDYAHKQGVVHRDIKPANIILLADLTPKIVDFGVAHIADNTITRTGLMVGTVNYMSPEQLNGARVDGRSDIFATAIVLYEFLANRLPFEGADTAAVMKKILMDPAPPLRQFVRTYPPSIDTILAKGLAKQPENRYGTADEMAVEIGRVRDQEQAKTVTEDPALAPTVVAAQAPPVKKTAMVAATAPRLNEPVRVQQIEPEDAEIRPAKRNLRTASWVPITFLVILALCLLLLIFSNSPSS
jgi:serine/threonine-protein kinase